MLRPYLAPILGCLCSLWRFRSPLSELMTTFAGFWNTSSFWCWNQAVLFHIIAPLSQSIGNAINYRFFLEKRLGKKTRQKFWSQNRYQKCSIVVTQFVSKPGDRKCLFTYWKSCLFSFLLNCCRRCS